VEIIAINLEIPRTHSKFDNRPIYLRCIDRFVYISFVTLVGEIGKTVDRIAASDEEAFDI
jgi:hypothetical protein